MLFVQIATAEIFICEGQKLYVAEGLSTPHFILTLGVDFFKKTIILYIYIKLETICIKKLIVKLKYRTQNLKSK